jgi:hypothetical protein
MGFELQCDWLCYVFALSPLKSSVVFDAYCKKLLALSISEACNLVNCILKIWLVIIIWQKFGDECNLVEWEFKKAFFDIYLIDPSIA